MHPHEKIRNQNAHIRIFDRSQVGIDSAAMNPLALKRRGKVFQVFGPDFGMFNFSGQLNVGMVMQKLKCADVFHERRALKIAGIDLYGMIQARGQLGRWLDAGGPEIFGQDTGGCPVTRPDIGKRRP